MEIHRANGGGTIPVEGSAEVEPQGKSSSILSAGEPPPRADQERAGAQPLAPLAVIAGEGGRSWIAVQANGDELPSAMRDAEETGFISSALTRAARLENPLPVHPMLAFKGNANIMRLGKQSAVIAIRADDLPAVLHETGRRISGETVRKLHRLAEHPFTWK